MAPKKRKPAKKNKLVKQEFDVEQTLLKNRQIFLFDTIDEDSAKKIVKHIYALDTLNNDPIHLYINSPGGSCTDGFAIIDAMNTVKSPVVTIITNEVCSMAAHISSAGDLRVCYENSVWMIHDMTAGVEDYSGKIKYRAKYLEKYYELLENNIRINTDLTEKEIKLARNGELWFFADDMLEKNIVDEVIIFE